MRVRRLQLMVEFAPLSRFARQVAVSRFSRFGLPLLAALAGLALYLRTLAPDVVGHDAGEFQFVPYLFGIPHATGYPLYLIVGKLWSLLPLGGVAWRMNLLSALFGALAIGLTSLAGQALTGRKTAALLAAGLVGLAPLEWTWSTIAGVRSLAVAFVAAVLLAACHWAGAARRGRSERAIRMLALVSGLALTHHRTIALFFPWLALFLLARRPAEWPRPRQLGLAGLIFLLPLSLYAVLPWRAAQGAPWDQFHADTWDGFARLVLAGNESAPYLNLTLGQTLSRWPLLAQEVAATFPPIGLALAALGVIALLATRPAMALLLVGATATLAFFTLKWNIGAQLNTVYLMPAYVPVALLAGAGWGAIRTVGDRVAPRLAPVGAVLGVVVVAWSVGAGLAQNPAKLAPPVETLDNFRQNLFVGHQARRLVEALATLPPEATVVADWDQATALWYGQFVEGVNRSVTIVYPATVLAARIDRPTGPLFLATAAVRPPAGRPGAQGPLVEVRPAPRREVPPLAVPLGRRFGADLELVGLAEWPRLTAGVLPVTLVWQAVTRPAADYSISVRVVAGERVLSQSDQAAPVLGLAPTSAWSAGEVVPDYYEIDPAALPEWDLELAVIVYQSLPSGGFRNLPVAGGERAVVGRLRVRAGAVEFVPVVAE